MSRRFPDAAQAYEAAIERTGNARERDFLQRSLEALNKRNVSIGRTHDVYDRRV